MLPIEPTAVWVGEAEYLGLRASPVERDKAQDTGIYSQIVGRSGHAAK